MAAHRLARQRRVVGLDRAEYGAVLGLDRFQIGKLALARRGVDADTLARNDEAAEIFEDAGELRIAGGAGDRVVEGEILVDRRLAARDRRLDALQRRADRRDLRLGPALRREAGGLGLDRHAQLHHIEHFADRAQAFGIDAEGATLHVARDESTQTLPRLDQSFRAQCRDRLAHHGAADAHRRHELVLRRQPRAGGEPAADLGGQTLHHLARQVARRDRFQPERLVSLFSQC